MQLLRRRHGGVKAYGQWQILLAILYEQDGLVDLSDEAMSEIVAGELELRKAGELDGFMSSLAEIGFIELAPWETRRIVTSRSVIDQIDYRRRQAENGSKGGSSKKSCPETGENVEEGGG